MPAWTLTSKGGGMLGLTSVGERNKAFSIRVWKPLPIRDSCCSVRYESGV